MTRPRPIRTALLLTVATAALSGCADTDWLNKVGLRNPFVSDTPSTTPSPMRPAVPLAPPPRPVTIVQMPTPLPLPGQLQPLPTTPKADPRPPAVRVDDANRAALLEPTAHGYINAVQVYPYTESALYRLFAAPEQVTDIALQPGETLTSVSAGDTVRWILGDTSSGAGESKRAHVLVKPSAPGLTTNLIIATDRRTYHLRMESTERTSMAAISWTYPQDQLLQLQHRNQEATAAEPIADGLNLKNLHFNYAISGDRPPWRPLRAFDDGMKVFVEFPIGIATGEMPPLFVVSAAGGNQLVNYRVQGNYYIVDRLFDAAELRLGSGSQQSVRITRTDGADAGRLGW